MYRKKIVSNIYLVFLYALKTKYIVYELSKLYELCRLYDLFKLHELCKIYELYRLYELCRLFELYKLYDYFMNGLKYLKSPEIP